MKESKTTDSSHTCCACNVYEHPDATKILVWSFIALICCGPIALYTLSQANEVIRSRSNYDISLVKTAKAISLLTLVLWAAGALIAVVRLYMIN